MSSNVIDRYDDRIARQFLWASVVFGLVAMLGGLVVACQMFLPGLGGGLEWLSFGRLRPVHTNAVIFAFVGNAMFAGIYHSTQRLCKRRMWNDGLSQFHFWTWQLIIVSAAVTLPLGFISGKEYAELEWPIDIAIAVSWVTFGVNLMGTIFKRREKHMYVALWFYIATFVTVALLHVVNSLAIPAGLFKSYSVFAGVQDALVQWWYGHNAVAFFLTTPFLGLMYYYLPKAANRPVYSYRLSIIHFWALIFIYIWAGPHHLLNSSLPEWCQSLGMVFSVMLIAPSWGGMLNGLLTLRGAWDRVRNDPVLKFFVVAITAYGMATFEGPLMSIKAVNGLSHYTDWTVAHTHIAGMGWNGCMVFGMLYFLIPKLYRTQLHSKAAAEWHFWLALLGIAVYAVPMYWAGITQGLMWRQFDANGMLAHPNFLETVTQIVPMYVLRAIGGLLYFAGAVIMTWNLIKTACSAKEAPCDEEFSVPVAHDAHDHAVPVGFMYRHRWLEGKAVLFTVLTVGAVAVGGAVQIIPMMLIKNNVPTIAEVKPYTALEQYGRDVYVRDNCAVCHSQMVRPFRHETERYGEYSKSGEFIYDRPFLWGSKRIGPDLHRMAQRNLSNKWQLDHLVDPQAASPGSIMPTYKYLLDKKINADIIRSSVNALSKLGCYEKGYAKGACVDDAMKQAKEIAENIRKDGSKVEDDSEMIALIAYLQRLGRDIMPKTPAAK